MRKMIVVGNWKMNKTFAEGLQLVEELLASQHDASITKIIAPPFIHLSAIAERVKSENGFEVAAQNCHQASKGAFTGEVSAEMIVSTGVKNVIIGHSVCCIYYNITFIHFFFTI